MRCKNCIALRNDSGYEHNATEEWCAVGEEEMEFADGESGCNRKSVKKLERDIKLADESDSQAFAEDCGKFLDYLKKNK